MNTNGKSWYNLLLKVALISVLALIMLIPLNMIRGRVDERAENHQTTIRDITRNWGGEQVFSGPGLAYRYTVGKDKEKETVSATLYPERLLYGVTTTSQELHRSIYDVSVYTAKLTIRGSFVVSDKLAGVGAADLVLNLSDLKGIQGNPVFTLAGKELKVRSCDKGLKAEVTLPEGTKAGDELLFMLGLTVNGSESLFFKPTGGLTEVEMSSDYPDPSFCGDFLPVEREVTETGFTAKWAVSQITAASGSSSGFGVRLQKPVTQYRMTERAIKYGLLVIFLVFIAGFVVEMVSRRPINLIQYMVIGASLVLFYSLLLGFSDFIAFGWAYLVASVMTVAALGAYFIGIVRGKWALLLTGLVALAYGVIYVLLRLETFAFLAGTLLLFLILCVVMALTRNLSLEDPRIEDGLVSDPK